MAAFHPSTIVCRQCARSRSCSTRPRIFVSVQSTPRNQKRPFSKSTSPREAVVDQGTRIDPDSSMAQHQSTQSATPTAPPLPPGSVSSRQLRLHRAQNLKFEDLPYQCFQEALKVVRADRLEKLAQIEKERSRLAVTRKAALLPKEQQPPEVHKRIRSLERLIEHLKVQADINDPNVKRAFEDGRGTMDKPVYRHLAKREWQIKTLPILQQRLEQMHVVPDLLPKAHMKVGVELSWGETAVQPGEFVESNVSQAPPEIKIRSFESQPLLVSIVVTDPDVPNAETDTFEEKVHYFATNVEIDPFSDKFLLGNPGPNSQVIIPWQPPVVQKGSPYHRLCLFVLAQKSGRVDEADIRTQLENQPASPAEQSDLVEAEATNERSQSEPTFRSLKRMINSKAIGAHMFRAQWDQGTDAIMEAIESPLVNTELIRERFYSPAKARKIERRREYLKR